MNDQAIRSELKSLSLSSGACSAIARVLEKMTSVNVIDQRVMADFHTALGCVNARLRIRRNSQF